MIYNLRFEHTTVRFVTIDLKAIHTLFSSNTFKVYYKLA